MRTRCIRNSESSWQSSDPWFSWGTVAESSHQGALSSPLCLQKGSVCSQPTNSLLSLQWGLTHSLFKVKYMLSVGASDQQRMFWFLSGCSQLNEIQPLPCLSPKTSQGDRQAGVGCVQHAEAGPCVLGLKGVWAGF